MISLSIISYIYMQIPGVDPLQEPDDVAPGVVAFGNCPGLFAFCLPVESDR